MTDCAFSYRPNVPLFTAMDGGFTHSPHLYDYLDTGWIEVWDHVPVALGLSLKDLYRDLHPPALCLVLNGAVNDLLTLVAEVRSFDGRPAARTARALFEALVNAINVIDSSDMADSYLTHASVTDLQIARRSPGLNRLPAKLRRGAVHRYKKMERSALARLREFPRPKGFDRSFASASLRNRAEALGLVDDYDLAYRFLCAPAHSSSGALRGTVREIDGLTVHRTGPNVELAAISFIEGVQWFRRILEVLPDGVKVNRFTLGMAVVDGLLASWPSVYEAAIEADRATWPKRAPRQSLAVAAIYGVSVRWFHWDPSLGLLWRADPPAEDPPTGYPVWDTALLEASAAERSVYNSSNPDLPFTIGVPDVTVSQRKGARPTPESAMFGQWPSDCSDSRRGALR